jgi:hypothetical protein
LLLFGVYRPGSYSLQREGTLQRDAMLHIGLEAALGL